MLDFDLFSIYVTTDEYRGEDQKLFLSFEDAMAARKRYANWFCDYGDVYIRRFVGGCVSVAKETWHVCADGHIVFHYGGM